MLADLYLLRSLLPAPKGVPVTRVEQLATPVDLIDAHLPLARLERAFRSPHLVCLAVEGDDDGVGMVTRARYLAAAAGDLGFGRALLARATVADVTEWAPTVVDPDLGIVEASAVVTARQEERRFDPMLVRSAQWGVVFPVDLVRALTSQLAVSTLRDELTGLGSLMAAHVELDERRRRAAGTPHHVAVVLVRLDGVNELRAAAGDAAADAVLASAADHLRDRCPEGWVPSRVGPTDLLLVGTLAGPLDAAGAMAALTPVERAVAGFRAPDAPEVRWRSAGVCSVPGGAAPDALLRAVRRRLAPPSNRQRGTAATALATV